MKHLKILGLAAVAAMAFMAFVGAGSASATVLCSEANTTTNCAEKNKDYGAGTVIDATLEAGTKAELWEDPKGPSPLVTCTESTAKGTTENTGGALETVHGKLEVNTKGEPSGLTWGGCSSTVDTIVTEPVVGDKTIGELEIHWIPNSDNGTVTSKGTDVTVSIFGVSCTYGSGTGLDLGTLIGGKPAKLSIEATVNKVAGGFLCPEHTTWFAHYVVTSPEGLWVSEK